MHFAQSKACAWVRTMEKTRISRALYLVDPEDVCGFDFGDCSCEIPLRNPRAVLEQIKCNAVVRRHAENNTARKHCTRLNLRPRGHKCNVVNSCNGLLCLSEPSRNDPFAVCNPITGEFVGLPRTCHIWNEDTFIDCGLGFSPRTNQYKVIRIFSQWRPTDPFFLRWHESTVAEVHTLGTGSRIRIGKALYSRENKLAFPTYLNGHLHWLFKNHNGPDSIVSFDLDTEQFHSVPLPPPLQWGMRH
ncbi:hypothetical protein TIFTF001_023973 [Ficus carica]|uniref:F-box associated beta-propeller type 3 domain-containing protein n=1 Tax=Ficus carica TaxID=3494 RepID=A0AA88DKA2_FICCA|nr:hypothetical protein TIFTF001_023973 [Ficus carica]